MNIVALLQSIQPILSKTAPRQMGQIAEAMVAMTGRVTMLGLSRWARKGGIYRAVQRFFNTVIPWPEIFLDFFAHHQHSPGPEAGGEYLLVGDECIVTNSGCETHRLTHFFASLYNQVVKGIGVFWLSLVSVEERRSYPMQVEQVIRSDEEKAEAKRRKQERNRPKQSAERKPRGRPKGNRNRDKLEVVLTPELKRVQAMIQNQLKLLSERLSVLHLALDGHFGNNNALQMVRQCGLHLASKLRHDATL